MTITTITNRVNTNGDGATTVFSFPYFVEDAGDLEVWLRSSVGAETLQTITSHYSLSGLGSASITVIMLSAPASGERLTMIRKEPHTNEISVDDVNSFRSQAFEDQFDRIARGAQHLEDEVGRSLGLKSTDLEDSTGVYDAQSRQIINVADGVDENDAVNKSQLDAVGGAPGGGDVVGPVASLDNALARFDGTTGKIIQNSQILIVDNDSLSVPGSIDANSTGTSDTPGSEHKLSLSAGTTGLFGWRMDSTNTFLHFDKNWGGWSSAFAISRNSGIVGIGRTPAVAKLEVSGAIGVAAGSLGSPAYSFYSDLDTGMYRIAADNLGVAAGGTKILDIDITGVTISGQIRIDANAYFTLSGLNPTIYFDASDYLQYGRASNTYEYVIGGTQILTAGLSGFKILTGARITQFDDDDTLAANSASRGVTQSAVKTYIDASNTSQVTHEGGYNATTNTPDLDTSPSALIKKGWMYTVTAAGTFFTAGVETGDVLIANQDAPTAEGHWTIVNKNLDAASIKVAYESNADTNEFSDAEQNKLGNISAFGESLIDDAAAGNARTTLGLGSAAILAETTYAEYLANTADKVLSTDQVWTAATELTLSDAATITVNMSLFINAKVTLAGNRTLGSPTGEKVGQTGFIRVIQDATGSRTLSFGTDYEFAGGTAPTLTTTANAEDLLFYCVLASNRVFISNALDIS